MVTIADFQASAAVLGDLACPDAFTTGAPFVKLNEAARVAVAGSLGVKTSSSGAVTAHPVVRVVIRCRG